MANIFFESISYPKIMFFHIYGYSHDFYQYWILSGFKDAIRSFRDKLLDKGYSFANIIDVMQLTSKFSENENAKDLANDILNVYNKLMTNIII